MRIIYISYTDGQRRKVPRIIAIMNGGSIDGGWGAGEGGGGLSHVGT